MPCGDTAKSLSIKYEAKASRGVVWSGRRDVPGGPRCGAGAGGGELVRIQSEDGKACLSSTGPGLVPCGACGQDCAWDVAHGYSGESGHAGRANETTRATRPGRSSASPLPSSCGWWAPDGSRPLHLACASGESQLVQWLVSEASPNKREWAVADFVATDVDQSDRQTTTWRLWSETRCRLRHDPRGRQLQATPTTATLS